MAQDNKKLGVDLSKYVTELKFTSKKELDCGKLQEAFYRLHSKLCDWQLQCKTKLWPKPAAEEMEK